MAYVKGQSGNPKGRMPRERETRLLKVMSEVVTDDEWREVCRVALEGAKKGNPTDRYFLAVYLLGRPQQNMTFGENEDGELVIRLVNSTDEQEDVVAGDLPSGELVEGDDLV